MDMGIVLLIVAIYTKHVESHNSEILNVIGIHE